MMQIKEFELALGKLKPYTDYLYFHLMGEPLCHPQLESYMHLAKDAGFKVILTTNGTLISKQQQMLLTSGVHKINISLHAFEANDLTIPFSQYLENCFSFGTAAEGQMVITYRLWNAGGADSQNQLILDTMKRYFPGEWIAEPRGTRIGHRIYLEHGDKFDWPDLSCEDMGDRVFCYGLRDQLGVLCDGTVVPCCLDHNGDLALGNLFHEDLQDILSSRKAEEIFNGFRQNKAVAELCRKCGYARRFRV